MINKLLQIIAPHYCYRCGKVGSLLCDNCKYDITCDPFSGCIVCARPSDVGICSGCQSSYIRAWCVGERSDVLEKVINSYKFERAGDAAPVLASLLHETVPRLPGSVIITNVPTVYAHIRKRGYDHAFNLAREFAKLRNVEHKLVLKRNSSTGQRGQSKQIRFEQAKSAFICEQVLDPNLVYVLVDDVVTTNASVKFAAQALIDAGASSVWVAVIARQPLK